MKTDNDDALIYLTAIILLATNAVLWAALFMGV